MEKQLYYKARTWPICCLATQRLFGYIEQQIENSLKNKAFKLSLVAYSAAEQKASEVLQKKKLPFNARATSNLAND